MKVNRMKKFAVFNGARVTLHTKFKLLPNRYISVNGNEATPIEDYGDWLLSPKLLTEDQALKKFIGLL